MLSRRQVVLNGGVAAVALPIVGCTSAQFAQFEQGWNNFVDQVNGILAGGCGLVPGFIATANSIAAVVGAFYPSAAMALAAGGAAIQAVAGAICSMVPAAPAPQLAAKLHKAAITRIPTVVGNVVINGKVIPVTGYGVRL